MKYLLVAAAALAIGWAAPAHAALVTFDFSAVQNGFVGDVPIPNGAAFNGSLTIDTSTPGISIPTGTLGVDFLYTGAFKSIDLSGEVIDVSGWAVNHVQVFNSNHTSFDFVAKNGDASIELFLNTSESPSPDPSAQLPTTLPDFSVFDLANSLDFGDASGTAHDTITNPGGAVNAVPEPSGVALLASSLLLLGLLAIGMKSRGEVWDEASAGAG